MPTDSSQIAPLPKKNHIVDISELNQVMIDDPQAVMDHLISLQGD
jgi:hypothetical protein